MSPFQGLPETAASSHSGDALTGGTGTGMMFLGPHYSADFPCMG